MHRIADANVLLPLLTEGHAHRDPATDWWEACAEGDVGLSLPVRMALLRPGGAVQCLIDDPRVSMVEEVPTAHANLWYANVARREPTPDLWTDAWLAALAQAHDCEMVTFDRGFRSFGLRQRDS